MRDFVRLVRILTQRAWSADTAVASEDLANSVLDEARRLLETGLHSGHLDLLREVMRDPQHRLPADDRVWELLAFWRLVPYPNESEWNYPHPLLTMHLLPHDPSG